MDLSRGMGLFGAGAGATRSESAASAGFGRKRKADLRSDLPKYAILSHTRGRDNEEVKYRELVDGTGEEKIRCKKI
jgi:hypothetical protein